MYNEKLAKEITEQVLSRLKVSSEKYGDAYLLNDMSTELDAELFDLVGWPLMQVLRFREAMMGRMMKIDDLYWKKFFGNQSTQFLEKLKEEIEEALTLKKEGDLK